MPAGYERHRWTPTDVIAISYNGRNIDGKYLEPKFCGVRPDVDWNEVVKEESEM